jgi:hypothetical protein
MSANTIGEGYRKRTDATAVQIGKASFAGAVRSEWTKLWSLRSTYWALLALVVLTIGLSALVSAATISANPIVPPDDPTVTSLAGLDPGMLVMIVLGAMFISGEYGTSSIRTSLVAVPRRLTFLGAKTLVLAVVALVAGTVTSFAAFFTGQLILGTEQLNVQLSDPGVLRAVIGGGLLLVGSAMFGFALGALLRSTAAGISVAVGALVVLPQLTRIIPGSLGETIQKYFTSNAGQTIVRVVPVDGQLGPWTGYLVFTLWWVALLTIAAILMTRRDA